MAKGNSKQLVLGKASTLKNWGRALLACKRAKAELLLCLLLCSVSPQDSGPAEVLRVTHDCSPLQSLTMKTKRKAEATTSPVEPLFFSFWSQWGYSVAHWFATFVFNLRVF